MRRPGGNTDEVRRSDFVDRRRDGTVPEGVGVRKHLHTFHCDAAGNRTAVSDGSGTCNYTSNNLNRSLRAKRGNQYTAAQTTSGNVGGTHRPREILMRTAHPTLTDWVARPQVSPTPCVGETFDRGCRAPFRGWPGTLKGPPNATSRAWGPTHSWARCPCHETPRSVTTNQLS